MQPRPVVLLADSDPATGALLQAPLEQAGYTVRTAIDGTTALAHAAGGVDLLLLDIRLQNPDALELCRRLRAQEAEEPLPIIVLVPQPSAAPCRAAFTAGADDCLPKPLEVEELLHRIRVWMRLRQRLRALHERSQALAEQSRQREEHAQHQAVRTMARTVSHELSQPLTVLSGLLELWESGAWPVEELERLRRELRQAAYDLTARVEALGQVAHYVTREGAAGQPLIDLTRAREPAP
ncbi:MAG TPA: response regulator [Chloroflexota bacterium]|nr:response regulator [Chloroflexota bacterium]HZU06705.1 response regulator [Chloroflexota bacterium]